MELTLHLTPKEIALCVTALECYKHMYCKEVVNPDLDLDEKYTICEVAGIIQGIRTRLKDIGGDEVERVLEEGFVTQAEDMIS
jgi:hypothetical protein